MHVTFTIAHKMLAFFFFFFFLAIPISTAKSPNLISRQIGLLYGMAQLLPYVT